VTPRIAYMAAAAAAFADGLIRCGFSDGGTI
jgi:hypothetical protein